MFSCSHRYVKFSPIFFRLNLRNPLAVVVNALTMTVGNINDAPLEMNALAIKDMRLTFPELQNRILYHYRQEVLRQLYRILGSADFIGNPVGLFTNVSSGVADIFYEPFQGVVMHGNRELGIGLAKVSRRPCFVSRSCMNCLFRAPRVS